MKINNRVPGLPEWPPIRFNKKRGSFTINLTHTGYARYYRTKQFFTFTVMGIAGMLCFSLYRYYAGKPIPYPFDKAIEAITANGSSTTIYNFFLSICAVFIIHGILTIFHVPRILSRFLYPKKTEVVFTPDTIEFNGHRFDSSNGVPILFQSENTPFSSDGHAHLQRQVSQRGGRSFLTYPLKFRNIEMVYGARLVKIADLPGPQRAQKFAIALQEALHMAKNPPQELLDR
jgi:hypothetical protein